MRQMASYALLGFILAICTPGSCLAWGDMGHRAVAEIAAGYLSETASARVQELLGEAPAAKAMADVASWPDENETPESYPWHNVDIPADGVRYDRKRDCENDDCIVEKITHFARVVGDQRIERRLRVDALKYLIHLVGDIHMPLHALAPLDQSEDAWVRIGERTRTLHFWWDNEFVWEFHSDSTGLADSLAAEITADQVQAWGKGTAADWANESFRIASEFVAAHNIISIVRSGANSKATPIELPSSVIDDVKRVIGTRLSMGGVRLAWLLNQAFR